MLSHCKRILTIASVLLAATAALLPATVRADETDLDESIRLPVRRLHPERARKPAQQPATDSDFARRMRSERARLQAGQGSSAAATAEQHSTVDKDWLNKLLSTDYTIKGIDSYMPQRLRWTDDPVPAASSLLADFSEQRLPGGARPVSMMINGGAEPARYRGLFRCVAQDEVVGPAADAVRAGGRE